MVRRIGHVASERAGCAAADLVYLDGPDYHDFSVDIETQADGVLLESKATEHYTILIDGRWKTFEFTRKNLKGEDTNNHSTTRTSGNACRASRITSIRFTKIMGEKEADALTWPQCLLCPVVGKPEHCIASLVDTQP